LVILSIPKVAVAFWQLVFTGIPFR
jgi:hypothetical protein